MPPNIDPQALIAFLLSILTQSPSTDGGTEIAGGSVPMGPPAFAKTPDPLTAQLTQLLQALQMQQASSPQQAANASFGQMGAMFGQMGGRPVGS